ncbi:threonine/serine dehydratase [Actinomadura namibiensis]|uniref:threonine ammonia-lyase n=1 Tax=Actinomadura kijaniata TaxID=46161 RepID=UPI003607F11E
MQETRLDTARIRAARQMIDPLFLDTPLYLCEALEPDLGCAVSIKLETANPVRSFKARGTEVVTGLLAANGSRAAVCASAGNLGQALAWSGRDRGLDITVVASRFAPAAKLERIRALGAGLELVDGDFDMARERAADIARHEGVRLVEDSLDIETCEGAATIGLELVDAAPSFDAVLVALGGGALATGVGHVVKALAPGVEVICVQPLGAPAMTRSWRQRRVVTTDSTDTIADGVAGRVPSRRSWTTSCWWPTTPCWSRRRRSSPVCGCSSTARASSSNRRPRSASRRSWRTVTASPACTWPPSCAAATSTSTPITAGSARPPSANPEACPSPTPAVPSAGRRTW